MILLLDNYDSFTYNLAQYLGELGCEVEVHRNDKISVEEIARRKPERIVISPGPCTPQEAGISIELVQRLAGKFPILGVCLGHQAMGAAFGGKIVRAPKLFHGEHPRIRSNWWWTLPRLRWWSWRKLTTTLGEPMWMGSQFRFGGRTTPSKRWRSTPGRAG